MMTDHSQQEQVLSRLGRLRVDTTTGGLVSHKPPLLLGVLELAERGELPEVLELTPAVDVPILLVFQHRRVQARHAAGHPDAVSSPGRRWHLDSADGIKREIGAPHHDAQGAAVARAADVICQTSTARTKIPAASVWCRVQDQIPCAMDVPHLRRLLRHAMIFRHMIGKLKVYRVEQCGYYARGADTHTCCDLHKCLRDICSWLAKHKPTVEKTCAFPGDEHGTSLPIYCFDAASRGKHDFLITTWNETPSEDGAVGAVLKNEIAGNADVKTTDLPQNSIPGYGTHFWFLADLQRLVTVRFDSQPLNGHYGLNLYMRGYLERFSPHVRFGDDADDGNVFVRNILGYAVDNGAEDADPTLRPRFKSVLLRRDSEIAYIRKNRAKIKRVIRKGRPTTGGQATRNFLDSTLVTLFGAGQAAGNRALPDKNFLFEIAYTPTAPELSNIINNYDPDAEHETWDDIGFDFAGESTRRWLSNSTLKVEVDLPDDLRDGPASLAEAGALLQALQSFRDQVSG